METEPLTAKESAELRRLSTKWASGGPVISYIAAPVPCADCRGHRPTCRTCGGEGVEAWAIYREGEPQDSGHFGRLPGGPRGWSRAEVEAFAAGLGERTAGMTTAEIVDLVESAR